MVTPRLSVLLPVYGGEAYLRQTLDALLAQTFEDFEIVAVNDCSPDGSREILGSICDPRLRVIDNATNLGQTRSLQVALESSRGELVARQDQDDVSLPGRFAAQVAYLDRRPEVVALGTSYEVIGRDGEIVPGTAAHYPRETYEEMAWRLCWGDRLVDPSVMFRRSSTVAVGGFDPRYRFAQDYDLWIRLLAEGAIARLPDVLLRLRIHPTNASSLFGAAQEQELVAILQETLNRIGVVVDHETAAIIRRVVNDDGTATKEEMHGTVAAIRETLKKFLATQPSSARSPILQATAEMFVKIAARNVGSKPLVSFALALQAVMLSPRLLNPATLKQWWGARRQARRYRRYVMVSWAE